MHTRLLAPVVALAAALLLPSAALAVGTPSITTPASSPFITRTAPITLEWSDTPDEINYRVFRADADCSTNLENLTLFGDLPANTGDFLDSPPADGTYCYYVQAVDLDGTTTANSLPVLVHYDTEAPSGTLTSPLAGAAVRGTIGAAASADDTPGGAGVATVAFQSAPAGSGTWSTFDTDGTGPSPYAGTLNTTGLTDGLYDLRVLVTDLAGNSAPSATVANVRVDNTAPSGSVTSPAASAVVHGTINPAATAADGGSGVDTVAFQRSPAGSGTWTTYDTDSSGPSPYGAALATTGLTDGLYDLRVLVTDLAGNSAPSATVTNVRVDNTAPSGTLTSPAAGAVVRGTINPAATASDGGAGVTSVAFQSAPAGSGTWTTYDTDTSAAYSGALDTTTLADGLYDLRVLVTDGATNSAPSATVANVRVDNTAPTVTLGGVTGDSNVRGTLQLTAAPADTGGSGVASVTFGRRAAGSSGSYTTIGSAVISSPYGVSFDTTAIADGNTQIQALATDVAGNPFPVSVTNVLIDNHVPTAPTTPTGLTPVSAAPTITFNGSTDPLSSGVASGVDHYDVYRDGAQVNSAPIAHTGAGPYTWSDAAGSSTSPASGIASFSYRVLAVDKSGNASVQSGAKVVVLDPTASSAPGSVTPLATPTTQRPQVSWSAPPAAPFLVDHYNVFRNGGTTPVGIVAAPATTFLDTTPGLPDGTYTYQVVAAAAGDATLGVASGAAAVTYDTTAPAPPGGVAATAALNGSIGIGWSAANDGAGSGIARYVVRRAQSSAAPATIADGDASCQGPATSCTDVSALNGKLYSYAVFAVDNAGNTSSAGVALGVTARDQLAPSAPTGLAATPGDASVDLRWSTASADDDVAGYVLVAKLGATAPSSEGDGIRVCSAIVAASTACTASGLTNGATYTFGLFALDEALNRSQAAVVSSAPNGRVLDAKATAAVTRLAAKVAGRKVTLTWRNPSDRDFDHVVITASERKPSARAAAKRVYSGTGTKATITLAPGQTRWFLVVAYDGAGNASAPATVRAVVAPASPFLPAPRAKVHGKVRLTWPVVKGAKYYNVQVYAGKKRVLVKWPAGRALQLPRAKLKRGMTYTWYVWPGLGTKAKARYGKLIGKNVFTFTG
jgi:fibronectin type 3 domain-containing protein